MLDKTPRLPSFIQSADRYLNDKHTIATEINNYFAQIGPKLSEKTPPTSSTFDSFLRLSSHVLPGSPLTMDELQSRTKYFRKKQFFTKMLLKTKFPPSPHFNVGVSCRLHPRCYFNSFQH